MKNIFFRAFTGAFTNTELKFILPALLLVVLACNTNVPAPVAQTTPTEQAAKVPDTSGSQIIPVMIPIITKIDSIKGFAIAKAVIDQSTLQPTLKVFEYLDENKKPMAKEAKMLPAIKR